jgi:hypothetical protein
METKSKDLYEAPTVEVVELKMENGILTNSNYYKNPYYEE